MLGHKSSFGLLFHIVSQYDHFKVFLGLCFPYVIPYNHHKLEPWSLLYTFLRYVVEYKGYYSLWHTTNKIYVFIHVWFNELSFPFLSPLLASASISNPISTFHPTSHGHTWFTHNLPSFSPLILPFFSPSISFPLSTPQSHIFGYLHTLVPSSPSPTFIPNNYTNTFPSSMPSEICASLHQNSVFNHGGITLILDLSLLSQPPIVLKWSSYAHCIQAWCL